ncbi:phage protein Gp36 family protein [Psychrobacter sp. I-STPA10]|uniref:phage protein Gp36 family protein n=1 Tax=Psychrobacter sp. I-STPA10 TaxID=2585769 RepID=UPI001E2B6CD6|nr:phage protein Gp36 family protein [Psychrobacter sp. I-STPA10]
MNLTYCTAADLVAHDNRARLISQLAASDYGKVPSADDVLNYFIHGTVTGDNEESLQRLKARVEQAISNSASEINGLLSLCGGVALPTETLTTINMDMALARLFEKLDDDSQIKRQADRWVAWLDKIATGKIPINQDGAVVTNPLVTSAQTLGSDVLWNEDTLSGY